jgi:hypothetical protein
MEIYALYLLYVQRLIYYTRKHTSISDPLTKHNVSLECETVRESRIFVKVKQRSEI